MQNGSGFQESEAATQETAIALTSEITELKDGFFAVQFEGDDGFEVFLDAGGATSDRADSISKLILEADKIDPAKTRILCKHETKEAECA